MQSVEQRLQICEKSVERVEKDITTAADQFNEAVTDGDKDRWWEEEIHLREEERLLLEMKRLLLEERAVLRGDWS